MTEREFKKEVQKVHGVNRGKNDYIYISSLFKSKNEYIDRNADGLETSRCNYFVHTLQFITGTPCPIYIIMGKFISYSFLHLSCMVFFRPPPGNIVEVLLASWDTQQYRNPFVPLAWKPEGCLLSDPSLGSPCGYGSARLPVWVAKLRTINNLLNGRIFF